jgi:hypothetical protein
MAHEALGVGRVILAKRRHDRRQHAGDTFFLCHGILL